MKVKPGIIRDIERGCEPEIDTIALALADMRAADKKITDGLRNSRRSSVWLVVAILVAAIGMTWIASTGGAPLEVQSVHVAGGGE